MHLQTFFGIFHLILKKPYVTMMKPLRNCCFIDIEIAVKDKIS
jgi:hypothetical protein